MTAAKPEISCLNGMDTLTPKQRSVRMSMIRSKNSKFELAIRSRIHELGFRYRLHVPDLLGKPDLVFPSRKRIAFLHSCFWHGHGCRLSRMPKTKRRYWINKIDGNRVRDRNVVRRLKNQGWRILVIWECEYRANLDKVVRRFIKFLEFN